MSERRYKHIDRVQVSSDDLNTYQRVNLAYQDKLGTHNSMQSPYTLDVDEQKVTNRRSAYPSLDAVQYFDSETYNQKKINMDLSRLVSAKMRERIRPELQPGQLIEPVMGKDVTYTNYTESDDTHILLYLGAFVIGIIIFTSLV